MRIIGHESGTFELIDDAGVHTSGIREGSRHWPRIQAAIVEGAEVDEYVAPEPSYSDLRRQAYPPIGDQLDAIWKTLNQWRLAGQDLPQAGADLLNAVLQVKNDYPKEAPSGE